MPDTPALPTSNPPPKQRGPRPGGCILSVLAALVIAALWWLFPAALLLFSFNDNGDPQATSFLDTLASVTYWGTRGMIALVVLGMVWAFWPRKPIQKQTPPGEDS